MQTNTSSLRGKIAKFFIAFAFVFSYFSIVPLVHADCDRYGATDTCASQADINAIVQSRCPQAVLQNAIHLGEDNSYFVEGEGTYIVGKDETTGQYITLKCNQLSDLETFALKAVVILTSIVGLVLMFSVGKSAILIMLAFGDAEKLQAQIKSIITALVATVGVFIGYLVLVFVLVGFFGVGTSKNHEWNVICQNRIMFNLTFSDSNVVEPGRFNQYNPNSSAFNCS